MIAKYQDRTRFEFLFPEELEVMTGYRRKKEQRQWLARNGIAFIPNRFGAPVVSRAAISERLSVDVRPSLAMPDLDALRMFENGKK